MTSTWWLRLLGLAVLNLFLWGPAWGKEPPPPPPKPFSDIGSYQEEYSSAGAMKFFDNTEDVLRMAQFERALLRFRFLKGQIMGKPEYSSLLPMVDMRIQWLKKQMHLRDWQVAAIRGPGMPRSKAKPAVKNPQPPLPPPPPSKVRKPGEVEAPKKPTAAVAPTPAPPQPAPAGPAPLPPPAAAPGPPPAPPKGEVVTTTEPKEPGKAQGADKAAGEKEAKTEEEPPAPPPGFWQRLRIRLHLQKPPSQVKKEKKEDQASKEE